MPKPVTQPATIVVPGNHRPLHPDTIVRLEGTGNYTLIHFSEGRKPLMVAQTVKMFQLQLPHFIRTNKSDLLNPAYIEDVIRLDARMINLRLTTGLVVGVSRRRVAHTLTELELARAQS